MRRCAAGARRHQQRHDFAAGSGRSVHIRRRAGQRLYFDALKLDSGPIYVTLTSPSGARVVSLGSILDHGPFYLTEAGAYTLLLDGSGDTTGDYSFRLVDLASATPINFGVTNAGQLAPQSRTAAYQFQRHQRSAPEPAKHRGQFVVRLLAADLAREPDAGRDRWH